MKSKKILIKFLSAVILVFIMNACKTAVQEPQLFTAQNSLIQYSGRTWADSTGVQLIGSASFARMKFAGDTCVIYLRNEAPDNGHNYVSFELDGHYAGRLRIENDSMTGYPLVIGADTFSKHLLTVYKATEAANGNVIFGGILCDSLSKLPDAPEKSIEFIGNSITCGYGDDYAKIPCDSGTWYDHHNAYFAYGPVVSRMLNVKYMLSSVSGIGVYRNWNVNGPTMPQVYENRYLNTDSSFRWEFSRFNPDVVSICLGTNDFSDGDGVHKRLPFDDEAFTNTYIRFVETLYNHYPEAQVALLSSPMLTGEKSERLIKCLNAVKTYFSDSGHKPIAIFEFKNITPHGCDYHPDIDDQELMAAQLYPFYKKLLGQTSQ
jgi:lysophospholipase L1-like esterase